MSNERYFLTLSYLGTRYRGWQTQKQGEITIQETLQNVLTRLYGSQIGVTASGRTDTGVHAEQQVAHVNLPPTIPAENLSAAINSILPRDIRLTGIRKVYPFAHARNHTAGKSYRYQIFTGPILLPFDFQTWHHFTQRLSTEALKSCAQAAAGTHNFAAFTPHAHLYASTWRVITGIKINAGPERIVITVTGLGFMRHMVRRLVGSMLEVARGKEPLQWFQALIDEAPPSKAGPTAPARGLTLERVTYPTACYNHPMEEDSTVTGDVVKIDEKPSYSFQDLEVRLMVVKGEEKGKFYNIPIGVTVIGRNDGEIRIPDTRISRKHALLEVLGPDIYYIKDLASSNGTYVNEKSITLTKLLPGDLIRVGDTILKFYVLKAK